MKKIHYIFLLFFYASLLYTMDNEKKDKECLTNEQSALQFAEESLCVPEEISALQLIEAIKNDSNNALKLAQALPENIIQLFLFKAARMEPLNQKYNDYPDSEKIEKYRQLLKKFNNKFITFILFQPWAGKHIKALNELAIWGQHATERVLFRAIKKKDVLNRIAIITTLLDNNTNGNTAKANKKAYTPFTKAVEKGRKDVMDLLRNKYANTYQKAEVPLVPTSQQGSLKQDINLDDSLYIAVLQGDCNLAHRLLEEGANIRNSALLPIAIEFEHPDMAILLINKGADLNLGNPLNKAIKKKYINVAFSLIEHGADISKGDPLGLAVLRGFYDLAILLTNKGADLNSGTPLAKAVGRKYFNIADFLIKKGADVNLGNPLLCAIRKGSTNIAALLIESGADPNKDNPLIAAVQAGNLRIATLLVKNGAKINLANQDGLTPLLALSKQKNISQNERQQWVKLLSNNSESSPVLTVQDNKSQEVQRKRKHDETVHVTFAGSSEKNN